MKLLLLNGREVDVVKCEYPVGQGWYVQYEERGRCLARTEGERFIQIPGDEAWLTK